MHILIVEDVKEKYLDVVTSLEARFPDYSIAFHRAEYVADFVKKIDSQKFDLMIFDIILPRWKDEAEHDVSIDLLDQCIDTINENTPAVALTAVGSPEYDTLLRFNEKSIPVLHYGTQKGEWVEQLVNSIQGLSAAPRVDFAICCALPKEAGAFADIGCILGDWNFDKGALRWRSITIGDLKGVLCIFPKMGMTHSALFTSKIIDFFHPPLLAMSGICAGIKDECNLMDIVIPETSWDHNVGKETDEGLKNEIHSENMDPELVAALRHYWDTSSIMRDLEASAKSTNGTQYHPKLVIGPVASGSVVVASSNTVAKIEGQQRKVVGLEMEFAAFFAACRFSASRPTAFGAKAVVDFADAEKDDSVQDLAARASARYIVAMIPLIINDNL